jgi:hypothetical protein
MVLTQYIINLIIFYYLLYLSYVSIQTCELYYDKCFAQFYVYYVTDSISVRTYGR